MQGMEREESGDEGAPPEGSRHTVEEPEQKKRTQDVQNQIRDMVSAGMQSVKLVIEHQGQPGQGMPEFRVGGAECPDNALRCNAGLDVMVFCDIDIVVNIDKVKLLHLPVHGKSHHCQHNVYDQFFWDTIVEFFGHIQFFLLTGFWEQISLCFNKNVFKLSQVWLIEKN